ncbi:MAG TPA: SBBP repeat-containing protein [Blastocatellia bacterium]|nr:SBBP repeat-containing protein [Blastocatellia bacterium]
MITSHKHTHTTSRLRGRRRVWVILACTGLLTLFSLLTLFRGGAGQTTVAVNGNGNPTSPVINHEPDAKTKARVAEAYGRLPLSFEVNNGQTDARAKFISRGQGYTMFLTSNEAVLSLKSAKDKDTTAVLKMKMKGASADPKVTGLEEQAGKSSYFLGNDPKKWHTNIAQYAKVKYQGVYPGIDAVYYGNQSQLEYDFVVAAGADPKQIQLAFDGAESLRIDENGDLVLSVAGSEVRQHKPVVYQEANGSRQIIEGRYVVKSENEVGFELGAYDATRTLVIDPVLSYATVLGGSEADYGWDIAVDNDGFAYVTGMTNSPDFPFTAGAVKRPSTFPGGGSIVLIYVAKLNQAGNGLVYAAYLGGVTPGAVNLPPNVPHTIFPVQNEATGIAIDALGNAYVVGTTATVDFPTTANGLIPAISGTDPCVVVFRLNPTGSTLVYSSYLGGGRCPEIAPGVGSDILERGLDIAVCEPGVMVVTGYTNSLCFPTTPGAFQRTKPDLADGLQFPNDVLAKDGFLSKIDTNRSGPASLVYSTYIGGFAPDPNPGLGDDGAYGVAVDFSNNIYVVGYTASANFPTTADAYDRTFNGGIFDGVPGRDAFLVKLCPQGRGAADLVYSTYLGGSGNELATSVAVDFDGAAYLTGSTTSLDLPVTANAFQKTNQSQFPLHDAFIAKIGTATPGAAGLKYLSYLGGTTIGDTGTGITVDCAGRAYLSGYSTLTGFDPNNPGSLGFPLTADAFDKTFSGLADGWVAIVDPASATAGGSLVYSSFVGDQGLDLMLGIALDVNGNFYLAGFTGATTPAVGNQTPPAAFPGAQNFLTPGGNRVGASDAFIVKFGGNPAGSCNDLRVPSDQKAGSLLFFNLYSSSINNPALENTRINLTNTNPDRKAIVHLFFVDGSNCSVADSYVCLTPNQTVSIFASDVDPGVMGYVIALATDENGCPANFNYLIGDEYVKLASGHAANLAAESFSAYKGCVECKAAVDMTALLRFDGISYSMAPRVLALDNIPSQAEGNQTMLVLNRVGGDLRSAAAGIGSIFGLLFDDLENSYSFTSSGGCQLKRVFNNSDFPRSTPRINTVIPAGHSGWMKLWAVNDVGILGAMINFNPSANVSAGAFNQGHNLHKLTLTNTSQLLVPIFPPNC